MISSSITIGLFTLHFYGLILGVAAVVGWGLASKIALELYNLPPKTFDKLAVYALFFGFLGARIYHVIDLWTYYQLHPNQILYVWQGGLGIFGGIIGGFIGILLYLSIYKPSISITQIINPVSISLPFSQAIGRLGNFVNQELYGKPTNLPWSIYIDPEHRISGFETYSNFHPLFAYESILNLFLGFYLYFNRHRFQTLSPTGVYFIGYGIIRLILEPLRPIYWKLGAIPIASIMSLLSIATGVFILLHTRRQNLNQSKSLPQTLNSAKSA